MGTSPLRVVILVAAVIVGIVGIAKAFPTNDSQAVARPPSGTTTSPSTTPSTPPKSVSPTPGHSKKPATKGVTVQVLNASGKLGVAGHTRDTIKAKNYGFTLLQPGNQTPHIPTTTIYYKKGFKASAQFLAEKLFPSAPLKQTSSSTYQADVTVVLGLDFSATTG